MEKNILIVNYNTQKLTDACIKSINKTTPDCTIYVFDNSDKEPFVNTFENVTVIDNTRCAIIDFDKWLEKYQNRNKSTGKMNNWGSAKHTYTVETFMEITNKPFILLDSDVLVKKDLTDIFNSSLCYVGEVSYQGKNSKIKRVLPFICFINTPICLENNIHFFDENFMNGLRISQEGDKFDTGSVLFMMAEKSKVPHGDIKVDDYVCHYGSGSWRDTFERAARIKHLSTEEWLQNNKELWNN